MTALAIAIGGTIFRAAWSLWTLVWPWALFAAMP